MTAAVLFSCTSSAMAQHAGDVWIGRSSAGQLVISTNGFIPADNYFALPPAPDGWLDYDPGFDGIVADEPENDVYVLESGAEIWLEVVAMDPAFQLVDEGGTFLDSPGDEARLGTPGHLHVHNIWFIDPSHEGFDPQQCVWHAMLVLKDKGSTAYSTSAPLVFSATNVALRYANTPIPPATFDLNADEAVDSMDYAAFAACLFGPGTRPDPYAPGITTCEVECLNAFDADNDQDIDLLDFAAMQSGYGKAVR